MSGEEKSALTRGRRDRHRRPWHLWLVAIGAFALYVGGARDFLLILFQDEAYMRAQFGAAGVTYFTDYPLVLRAVWAVNIIGGLVAPVLLIARSRWALLAALVATLAQVVLLAVTFTFLDRWSILGAFTSWFDIGVGVLTALLAAYCWAMNVSP